MTLYLDWNEWKQGVASWLDVTSGPVFNNTGTFIRLAELELDKKLRLRQAIRFASNEIDNDGILTLPDDFAQMKSVNLVINGASLEAVTIDQYYNMLLNAGGVTGADGGFPCHFAIIGEKLQFVPLGSGQDINIAYYRKTQQMGDTVPETIYSIYAPEALLSLAVMQGFKYDADEPRMAAWKATADEQIMDLNRDAKQGELGTSPLKMRSKKIVGGRRGRI